MTEDSKTTPPEDSPATPATAEIEAPRSQQATEPAASVVRESSRSGLFAIFLSLLALIGLAVLGAVGYLQLQSLQQRDFGHDQSLTGVRDDLSRLDVDNKSRNQWFDAASDRSSKLDRQIQTLQQQQTQSNDHRGRLDQALSLLAQQVQGGQMAWRKAEIEHLLLVANARAQLEKDPAGALTALELASGRLADLADPAFYPVQQAIGREIARLEATQPPDLQGLALKLSALSDQIDALTIKQRRIGRFDTELSLTTGPVELPWHQRLWISVREAAGSLVSIRKDNERREPLMPPDQEFYLRQNLRLQLESARLALLREDDANYQSTLRQAELWLQQYFDISQPATKAALTSIKALSTETISFAVPDISGSLKALRGIGAGA